MRKFKIKSFKVKLHKIWSYKVRSRDNWICQWCLFEGKKNKNKRHHAHHVVPVGVCGNAGRYEIDNGMTLCYHCHIDRIKSEPDEYIKFRDIWLRLRNLDYFQMRDSYRECVIKFTQDFYNQKLIGLEEDGERVKEGRLIK